MGYRFVVDEMEFPQTCKAGEKCKLTFTLRNIGVAPIYNRLPFKLCLKGENGKTVFATDIDACKWLPGEYTESAEIALPADLKAGKYTLSFGLGSGDTAVRFAIETETEQEWHTVANVEIVK